jgi:hypothetical protein
VFCCYRCANFAGGVLPNRATLAADRVANLAMSSRRRNFCFLNLLNLALSPFCDDICPRSSNLFVTQRAEDKSVRSSIHQATDGRCEAQSTLRRNPLQRLRVRLLGLLLAADKMSCGMPAAYSIFRRSCHVVADSETWPAQWAVVRFPRNVAFGNFESNLLKSRAGSTGRCNTSLKFTCRSLKTQGLSGSLIQTQRDLVEMGLRVDGQVGPLWEVLS